MVHQHTMTTKNQVSVVGGEIMIGALLMVVFSLIAPVQDTIAKLATDHVSSGSISFTRFAVQTLVLVPLVIWRFGPRRLWPKRAPHLHALRGVLMAIVTVLFVLALESMHVADAMAIFFVEPMFLTLLSGMILREKVGWRRYAACAVGFVGALFVIQPSFEELGWVAFLPLGVAFLFAFYLILTRQLSQDDEPMLMQAYTGVSGAIFLGAVLLIFDPAGVRVFQITPPQTQTLWIMLAAFGLIATVNHLILVQAFKRAPASILAPIQYLEIVTGVILGWIIWDYVPNALKWVGIGIIVGSGLFIIWRERIAAQKTV
jgi:S-adenosylmethionine uptake transporter